VEKVGNYLKEDLAKPGYKSKHESTKRSGWLEWRSRGLPTSEHTVNTHMQQNPYAKAAYIISEVIRQVLPNSNLQLTLK
jgi:hypothetical protein